MRIAVRITLDLDDEALTFEVLDDIGGCLMIQSIFAAESIEALDVQAGFVQWS